MNEEYNVTREEVPGLEGMYPAAVDSVSEVKSGNYGNYVIIGFCIPGDHSPSGRDFIFTIPFSMSLSSKSRLGKLTKAVFGKLPESGRSYSLLTLPSKKLVLCMKTEIGESFDKFIIVSYHPADTPVDDPRTLDEGSLPHEEIPF